ncbi:Cathepsin L2 [Cichlidogyrus casuarinus]|uniref:Cathepsin L2 n=1 Tax=Cichlidogyrus casuarinus TaxID=1844966 RepID=A0ABD2Q5Y6_9PLAT
MTKAEFAEKYLTELSYDHLEIPMATLDMSLELPAEVDWVKEGKVTPIEDQGGCGSCYAFSAAGCIESQLAIERNSLVPLSKQQIVDCSAAFGNQGCHGGLQSKVFEYLLKGNKKLQAQSSYPYEGKVEQCRYEKSKGIVDISHWFRLNIGNEIFLQYAVATVGPISVGIDARDDNFHFYKSGTYYNPSCSQVALTHAVLIVGYGTDEKGIEFWKIKNSWSASWGENGYGYMARNKNNMCGIASLATYAILPSNAPPLSSLTYLTLLPFLAWLLP